MYKCRCRSNVEEVVLSVMNGTLKGVLKVVTVLGQVLEVLMGIDSIVVVVSVAQ